jgi:hypothetical protein
MGVEEARGSARQRAGEDVMWSVEVEGRERGSEGLTYEKSGYEKRPSDNLARPRQKSQGRFS